MSKYHEMMWVLSEIALMTVCLIFQDIFDGNADGIIAGCISSILTFYFSGLLAEIKYKK